MLQQTWRRYLRVGSRGEDVRHVQELLRIAGHDPGPIDGIFGSRTKRAVVDFQGANRLVQDGIVGPRTWEALTKSGTGGGAPKGISLHIGLNVVDDDEYGARIPPLTGCVNDANAMEQIARSQGYASTKLLDREGTVRNIVDAIDDAARQLRDGDIFLMTYAGHGSQIPDTDGEEKDGLDETWVAYDRQLIDDELYALWGRFAAGVRILVVSDSCHSGTMTRAGRSAYQVLADVYQDDEEVGFVLDVPEAMGAPPSRDLGGWSEVRESVREVMPSVVAELRGTTGSAVRSVDVDRYTDLVLAPIRGSRTRSAAPPAIRTRDLPAEIAYPDAGRREKLYRDAKAESRSAAPPDAHVLLISACQDHQLALDGVRNGLFTQRLLEIWDQGQFNGVGYAEFHRRIVGLMPPQQIPNLFWATPPEARFQQQHPFTI